MASVEENWHTSGDSDIARIGVGVSEPQAYIVPYILDAVI